MLDFLFITSPSYAANPHPPYYFLYLAAYLRSKGLNVKILDPKGKDRPKDIENHIDNLKDLIRLNKSRFVGLAAFHNDYPMVMRLGKLIKKIQPYTCLLVGNAHATIDPQDFIYEGSPFDIAVLGEGEETCWELWQRRNEKDFYGMYNSKGIAWYDKGDSLRAEGIKKNNPRPFMDLKDLPRPAYDLIDMDQYLKPQKLIIRRIYTSVMPIYAGRGCAWNCLQGDSQIDIIDAEGLCIKKSIKDLVGKTPLVLTRDPKTKKAVYVRPTRIFKTRGNAELVKVHFQSGKKRSYLDCTPDHRFMALQYKNQYQPRKEWEIEAKDLRPGQSVVACRYTGQLKGYRTLMKRITARELKPEEHVHHKDKNVKNGSPLNLQLTRSIKDHFSFHPERSERMRGKNNPVFLLSPEERVERNRKNNLGKKRTLEQKEKYRQSKLGAKNPNYGKKTWNAGLKGVQTAWNKGLTKKMDERIKQYGEKRKLNKIQIKNHKVLYIEYLQYREDVYCMELPGYDWFFANDILVHNCSFCASNTVWKANTGKSARMRSVDNVLMEIRWLKDNHDLDFFYIFDDTFGMSKKWMKEWFEKKNVILGDMPYACQTRANLIDDEMIKGLKCTGCIQVDIGVETGSQRLLDLIHKQITVAQVERSVSLIRRQGLRMFFTMLLNLPTETRTDLNESWKLLKKLKPDGVIFGITTPYPGTKIYSDHFPEGLRKDEYHLLTGNRLDPLDRFRMADHNLNLWKLWDIWNLEFRATPFFERMWPKSKLYWRTVWNSKRFWQYIICWLKDVPKTAFIWMSHKLGVYRWLKRMQYKGEKG